MFRNPRYVQTGVGRELGLAIGIEALSVTRCDGGAAAYSISLVSALRVHPLIGRMVVFTSRPGAVCFGRLGSEVIPIVGPIASGFGRFMAVQTLVPLLARRLGLHAMVFTGNYGPIIPLTPSLVVFHGALAIPSIGAQFGRVASRTQCWVLCQSLRRAHRIVTVSEYLRTHLVSELGSDFSNRIRVIPEGAIYLGDDPMRPDGSDLQLTLRQLQPFVLFVSDLYRYKGLDHLLQAMAHVAACGFPHRLVVVGRDVHGDWPTYEARARLLGLAERVVYVGPLPFEVMPLVYRHADLLVYPSQIEGFGRPLLEAMANGIPVVASKAGSIPEVVGDAAILVDTADTKELGRVIVRVLEDRELRRTLVSRGRERIKSFDWKTIAERFALELLNISQRQPSV